MPLNKTPAAPRLTPSPSTHSKASPVKLIWEAWAMLPGRGIYWQGKRQTQSITPPVCLIISHQERWPANIDWLFHKNNPFLKTMLCQQPEAPFLCTSEWDNSRETKRLAEAVSRHDCMCEGVWRAVQYVSWWQLLQLPGFLLVSNHLFVY